MTTPTRRTTPSTKPQWAVAIEIRRTQLQLSQELLAEKADMSQSYYSEIERGARPLPTLTHSKLLALAQALNWSLAEMQRLTEVELGVEASEVAPSDRVTVAVYALANAGVAEWTEGSEPLEYIQVEPHIAAMANRVTFRVCGDSMSPTIEDGDYIHVDVTKIAVHNGKVYLVQIEDNGNIVKRYKEYHDGSLLVSDNSRYAPITPDSAKVIGQVVAVTPKTRILD